MHSASQSAATPKSTQDGPPNDGLSWFEKILTAIPLVSPLLLIVMIVLYVSAVQQRAQEFQQHVSEVRQHEKLKADYELDKRRWIEAEKKAIGEADRAKQAAKLSEADWQFVVNEYSDFVIAQASRRQDMTIDVTTLASELMTHLKPLIKERPPGGEPTGTPTQNDIAKLVAFIKPDDKDPTLPGFASRTVDKLSNKTGLGGKIDTLDAKLRALEGMPSQLDSVSQTLKWSTSDEELLLVLVDGSKLRLTAYREALQKFAEAFASAPKSSPRRNGRWGVTLLPSGSAKDVAPVGTATNKTIFEFQSYILNPSGFKPNNLREFKPRAAQLKMPAVDQPQVQQRCIVIAPAEQPPPDKMNWIGIHVDVILVASYPKDDDWKNLSAWEDFCRQPDVSGQAVMMVLPPTNSAVGTMQLDNPTAETLYRWIVRLSGVKAAL